MYPDDLANHCRKIEREATLAIEEIPGVRNALFESAGRAGYALMKLPILVVKTTIFAHPEFTAFNQAATKVFADWKLLTGKTRLV